MLSHQERNGVRAAYIHKAEHLEERRLFNEITKNAIRQAFNKPGELNIAAGLPVAHQGHLVQIPCHQVSDAVEQGTDVTQNESQVRIRGGSGNTQKLYYTQYWLSI